MTISDVLEPVDLRLILEKTQGDRVYRRVTPALVEETASAVQVLKVGLISRRPPEAEITDLKVGPEMTGAVAARDLVMTWSSLVVRQPVHSIVFVKVLLVGFQELQCLRPECLHRQW